MNNVTPRPENVNFSGCERTGNGDNRASGSQPTENDGEEHNVSTTQARWVAKESIVIH